MTVVVFPDPRKPDNMLIGGLLEEDSTFVASKIVVRSSRCGGAHAEATFVERNMENRAMSRTQGNICTASTCSKHYHVPNFN